MPNQDHPNGPVPEWTPCPPGKLRDLKARLAKRRQRRRLLRNVTAMGVMVATAGVVATAVALTTPQTYVYAGLSCNDIPGLMEERERGDLSDSKWEKVKEHLSKCPICEKKFKI